MTAEFRRTITKGEPPLNWHLNSFPTDAKLVLWIRSRAREYLQTNKIGGPVADLEAEQKLYDTDTYFRITHDRVKQPITFVLPNPVLRLLSLL